MPQHLLHLPRFLECKKVETFADRSGKFGELPTDLLSGGVTPPHPTVSCLDMARTWNQNINSTKMCVLHEANTKRI